MPSPLRLVFRNIGLKLAAIFLAVALYLHVRGEAEREAVFSVPIRAVGGEAAPTLLSPLPDSARVRILARARDLDRWGAVPGEIVLDLSGLPPGVLVMRPLTGSDLTLREGIRAVRVEVLEPRIVSLQVAGTVPAGGSGS